MELDSGDYASIALYAHPSCPHSHRTRFAIIEKQVVHRRVYVNDRRHPPEEFLAENPSGSLPTLVDHHLAIYDVNVIESYLNERFPYPPMLPVEPRERARVRMMIRHIEKEWYSRVDIISKSRSKKVAAAAREELRNDLIAHADLFKRKWFLSETEFMLVDCIVAPVLWRLPSLGIHLHAKRSASPIRGYMKRVFSRNSFRYSLSEEEIELFTEA